MKLVGFATNAVQNEETATHIATIAVWLVEITILPRSALIAKKKLLL